MYTNSTLSNTSSLKHQSVQMILAPKNNGVATNPRL